MLLPRAEARLRLARRRDAEQEREGGVLTGVRKSDGGEVVRAQVAQSMGSGVAWVWVRRAPWALPPNSYAVRRADMFPDL